MAPWTLRDKGVLAVVTILLFQIALPAKVMISGRLPGSAPTMTSLVTVGRCTPQRTVRLIRLRVSVVHSFLAPVS
jgi:hypothetical protein